MIEIVFSNTAGSSLQAAQHFGGDSCSGVTSIYMEDTAAPDSALVLASQQGEADHRRARQNTQLLNGSPEDVFVLPLALSVGEITEEIPGEQRLQVLRRLMNISDRAAKAVLADTLRTLRSALDRSAAGEPCRVWYSAEPDEMSGLYWLMAQMVVLDGQMGPLSMVRLPFYEQCRDEKTGTGARVERVVQRSGWGDVAPEEWGHFLNQEVPVSPLLMRVMASRWNQLQKENAPLRAVLNGNLVSLPADIYDSFLRAALADMDEEFDEAVLIGNVLSQGRGPGDMLFAERIQTMVDGGELSVIEEAPPDAPYRRRLRKNGS